MSNDEARMSFTEHLAELRTRLIRALLALAVGTIICIFFSEQLFHLIARPMLPLNPDPAAGAPAFTVLNPMEAFTVRMRLGLYCGMVLALPYMLYQLLAFVSPGLKPVERKAVNLILWGSGILVVLGFGVAYFGVLPFVLPYLLQWAPEGVTTQLRMSETVSLILKTLVGFAIGFQMPVVVLILVYLNLLTPELLVRYRRIAIVGLAIVAAVVTPPDPYSMIIMLVPLVGLYEISVLVAKLVARRKARKASSAGA